MIIASEENWRQITAAIKAAREKRKLSIARLAELVGIDRAALWRLEAGEKLISEQSLWALLHYLRLKIREGGIGPEPEPIPRMIVCPKCLYRQRLIL